MIYSYYLCNCIAQMGCTRHSSSKLDSALICTIFIIVNDIISVLRTE